MANDRQNIVFGVESDQTFKNQANYNIWQNFTRLLPLRFWFRYYVISLIVLYFFYSPKFHSIVHPYKEFNFFLFPFAVYLYAKMLSRLRIAGGTIYDSLTLNSLLSPHSGFIGTVVGIGIKLFIIYVLWFFSFVLGILGIIFFLVDFQRLRR